ncbi:MAG TPA: glycosyltransferase family 4 protein [Actinomycetota bacterium]|nr:glycosyltransferase family 4 protein [Actinomycetota bacterium]
MRIAFVPAARLLSDRDANGEALIASAFIRTLAARGHDVIAYCERSELPAIERVDVREIPVTGPTAALGRIAFARRIARDLSRERVDVAHLLFPFTTHDGYAMATGVPLVCGPINLPWPSSGRRPRRAAARAAAFITDRYERRLHARTMERASRLFVTGTSSSAAIPTSLRDRCVELPFGVDLHRFAATPLPDNAVILFLSVLLERKGIDVLLRALPQVRAAVPRARLLIAGDDPSGMRPKLERLARELGVHDAIEFAGPVAPSDVPGLYRSARVFCQPSYGEPFGMTVVEAMASARPVVATSSGGIADAVDHGRGGRLVPPGDPALLAGALVGVLASPRDAEAMAGYNRARAEQRYSLDGVVDRLEQTYAELARSNGGVRHVAA